MRRVLPFLFGICLAAPVFASDWRLLWSADFSHDGPPDPAIWNHEVGFTRNQEVGYYTGDRLENARQEKGQLILEARKEEFPNARPKLPATRPTEEAFAHYTSASLTTHGKFAFRYGRVEVVAKVPRGDGVWPAIWTLGEDCDRRHWPACGEIDIMELFGRYSDEVAATLHFKVDGQPRESQGRLKVDHPSDAFHTYAMEWDEHRIVTFFDDQVIKTFDLDLAGRGDDNPFRRPHFLILDVALASNKLVGHLDDAVLPQRMVIRSMRVLQKPAAASPEQPAAVPPTN